MRSSCSVQSSSLSRVLLVVIGDPFSYHCIMVLSVSSYHRLVASSSAEFVRIRRRSAVEKLLATSGYHKVICLNSECKPWIIHIMRLLVILSTYAMEDGQTATSVPHHHRIYSTTDWFLVVIPLKTYLDWTLIPLIPLSDFDVGPAQTS